MIFYSVAGKEMLVIYCLNQCLLYPCFFVFKRDAQYHFDKNKSLYFWVDIDYHSLKISTFVVVA
jgi:hypothetical protein